jgi:DNA-binding Lrp family transcriptional regulator
LESVLCSKQTIRILKLLKQMGRLNVSEIAKHLGTNYEATSTRLESLENEGVLRHIELGRARLYSFKESPRARAVADFLEVWET